MLLLLVNTEKNHAEKFARVGTGWQRSAARTEHGENELDHEGARTEKG